MGLFGKKKNINTGNKVNLVQDITNSKTTPSPLDEFYKALKENAYDKLIAIIQSLRTSDRLTALYVIGNSMKGKTNAEIVDNKIRIEKLPDIENIELEKILLHFAINDSEYYIRHAASQGIKKHELLYQLVLLSPGGDDVGRDIVRDKRVFTDVDELENIVANAKYNSIKHFAVLVLDDQAALERIARNKSIDTVARVYAYKKLIDPNVRAELKSLDL